MFLIPLLLIILSPPFSAGTLLGVLLLLDFTEPLWHNFPGSPQSFRSRLARFWHLQTHPLAYLAYERDQIAHLRAEIKELRHQLAELRTDRAAYQAQTVELERQTAELNARSAYLERQGAVIKALTEAFRAGYTSDLMVIAAAETTGESLEFCFAVKDELDEESGLY